MSPIPISDDDRLLPLAGGRNFRDMAGYTTGDGRRVRPGMLYRSGTLSGLTDADVAELASRGIEIVCDLRMTQERRIDPSVTGFAREHKAWDYEIGHNRLHAIATADGAIPQHLHDELVTFYAGMPWLYADMYRATFAHLVAGDVPLLFHCAGGKDRTGMLAALILATLGVPGEQILADYRLTDRFLKVDEILAAPPLEGDEIGAAGFAFIRTLTPEMRRPLLVCEPAFLQAALRAIDNRHGSVLAYAEDVLGIDAAGVATLKEQLLESADA